MATLIIRRSTPFIRGMQSIQILVDGQKSGMIRNDQPLHIAVAPGRHTIWPGKNGVSGQAFDIMVTEGETRYLALNDVHEYRQFFWFSLITILITSVPDDLLGGRMFWIKLVIYAIEFCLLAYLVRMRMRNKLTLTEDPVNSEKGIVNRVQPTPA